MKNKFVSKKTVLILACIAIALLLVVLYLLLAPLFYYVFGLIPALS